MGKGWVLDEKRLPALPVLLRQPGGDLLGGPEAPEGSVEVNSRLLDPRWVLLAPQVPAGLTAPQPSHTRTVSAPLPALPLPPSTPRIWVCGFVYLPAPRIGAGAPGSQRRARGDAWPIAQCSGFRATASMRTKALRAWAGNLEVGQVALQGGGREEGGRDAAETPFLLPSPSLRHRERLRITWD